MLGTEGNLLFCSKSVLTCKMSPLQISAERLTNHTTEKENSDNLKQGLQSEAQQSFTLQTHSLQTNTGSVTPAKALSLRPLHRVGY